MTARHKTYKGKEFNMSAFSEKNADARAVGNVNMNARGDVLDSKGKVKVSAGQISRAFSANNNKKTKQVSLKEDSDTAPVANKTIRPDPVVETKNVAPVPDQIQKELSTENEPTDDPSVRMISRREIRTSEGPAYEIEYADGSMEIVPIRK